MATLAVKRVPASIALLALRQSGYVVTPGALRIWVHRGRITRGDGGYDLEEIVAYLESRETPPPATSVSA